MKLSSRFERRIVAAIFLAGMAPFLISLMFVPAIVESRVALSVHATVRTQLEAAALFYKEFFVSKKSEFAARAEVIARDPILVRAASSCASTNVCGDLESRMDQTLEDSVDLAALRVVTSDGKIAAERSRPYSKDEFSSKTILMPMGLGAAARIEVTLLLPNRYIRERARAEEVLTLYQTATQVADEFQKEQILTYVFLTSIALLSALTLGFLLARQVTKRISDLVVATEKVARGDRDVAIEPSGKDEITELTRSFNKMVDDVRLAQERIVYLEKVSGWQELARRLAHEIKNPLTPIQLAIQELRRRAPEGDPRFKKLVDDATNVVEEEIASLTRLVNEFSQFARLPEVVKERVEVRAFVEDFLTSYNRFEPDAVVDVALGDEPLQAGVDRVLMRRVLANLATNAIQAAGAGRAKLRVSCAQKGPNVEIRIEDNGPGVQAADRAKIFEPYFTTKSEGTGLGLAIVKKIVLQHDGAVSVGESTLGGASFVITVPAADT